LSTVIKVENLGKQYRLGQVGTGTISHDLNLWWNKVRGKEDPYLKIGETNDRTKAGGSNLVWALKDLNFEVKQGEVLGIIGRNGAGKSTLLKILSRVTGPTVGDIKVRGRIAALLEVGTGFHPDLSGRENIFLNGAILGMNKQEIRSKFDEIVDFSGVERYIDTPVKRYSSGMYVRLAFAVAAHLEPEILIVDEVLAVGDAEFQKKCLGKMKDISGEGRTVLFVSHNMETISALTKNSILLDQGKIIFSGETPSAIENYLSQNKSKDLKYARKNKEAGFIDAVELVTSLPNNCHQQKKPFSVKVTLTLNRELKNGGIALQILDKMNRAIVHTWHFDNDGKKLFNALGTKHVTCQFDSLKLYKGHYSISVFLAENFGQTPLEQLDNICPFNVEMLENYREFAWQDGTCSYIEDFSWE
jgi:lipopolysaccharide transport system ATP-binding protein